MKVAASSLRKGSVVDLEGKLYVVLSAENIHPGKGTPVSQIEMRRIGDGVKVSERYKTTDQVVAIAAREGAPTSSDEWVGIGFRLGAERFVTGRADVREVLNEVVSYGTNVVVRALDTPQGPRQYWRVLRMYATSYHPAALGGDDVTANGRRLTTGIIASNPRVLPYGTEVYVEGYGVGLMADTGGPRRFPLWIDLGYSDADFRSWSRYVNVYILTPVPPTIDYIVP